MKKTINIFDVCNYNVNIINHNNYLEMTKELIDKKIDNWKYTKWYNYYKKPSPKNINCIYNTNIKVLEKISAGRFFLPWVNDYPQSLDRTNSCLFGKKDDEFIYKQILKTKNLIISIKKNDYVPTKFVDRCGGYIVVQQLKYNNENKYYVIAGNHRINVLQSLGYKNVEVLLVDNNLLKDKDKINNKIYNKNKDYPCIINYDNAENWPAVKSSYMNIEEAQKMFLSYF